MLKLNSNNNIIHNKLKKITDFEIVDDSYKFDTDDVVCFYVDSICTEEIINKKKLYNNLNIILIFDRTIAFHFFDIITLPLASYILFDELESQFILCYETTKKSGIYISEYFRQITIIKCKYNGLSNRDLDVVELLKDGYSYKEIATVTNLTYGTVRNYVSRILAITDSENKTELALHFQDILKDSEDY